MKASSSMQKLREGPTSLKALNMANVEMRRTVKANDSTYSLTHRSPDLKFLKLLLFFWELISFKTTFI